MADPFRPDGLPVFIGSLPFAEHQEALKLVLQYTPEIPLWTQLPLHAAEGMVVQFTPGMPGLCTNEDSVYVDTAGNNFEIELTRFYEEYMAVVEENSDLTHTRFVLGEETAKGFFIFIDHLKRLSASPDAVKGQITGPFTFCTGIADQNKKAIIYDEQIKDAAVKLLALKARWQTRELRRLDRRVIIFIDEPALAGFGSSEYITISPDEIAQNLEEVIAGVHAEGGLAGVHVCANTDWSLILDSSADIVSFDAYSYFDRFMLYSAKIKEFLDAGKIIAWGMVPTLKADELEKETTESLVHQWREKADQIKKLGIELDQLLSQSLITPSCGAGSLRTDQAVKVLELTQGISEQIRAR